MSKKNKQKKAAKTGNLKIQPVLAPSANGPAGAAGEVATQPGGTAVTAPPADRPVTPQLAAALPLPLRKKPVRGPLPFGKGDVRGFVTKQTVATPPARGFRIRPL